MAKINSISPLWGREYKLEEKPFDTLNSKSVQSSSKYSLGGGYEKGQSMLIDAIIKAVHEYINLLDEKSDVGAIGTNKDDIYVERQGKNEDTLQILIYNKNSGSCVASNYNKKDGTCDVYDLK